jgi:hypothetical protein
LSSNHYDFSDRSDFGGLNKNEPLSPRSPELTGVNDLATNGSRASTKKLAELTETGNRSQRNRGRSVAAVRQHIQPLRVFTVFIRLIHDRAVFNGFPASLSTCCKTTSVSAVRTETRDVESAT